MHLNSNVNGRMDCFSCRIEDPAIDLSNSSSKTPQRTKLVYQKGSHFSGTELQVWMGASRLGRSLVSRLVQLSKRGQEWGV